MMRQNILHTIGILGLIIGLGLMAWLLQTFTLTDGVIAGTKQKQIYQAHVLLAYLPLALALLCLLRLPARWALVFVPVGMLVLGFLMLTHQPLTSTDAARYNWDGIVQKAGISPYKYAPADAALKSLRPPWLFSNLSYGINGDLHCDVVKATPVAVTNTQAGFCTGINRPTVNTIYPPIAEILFLLMRIGVGNDVAYLPAQVIGLVALAAVTLLLLITLSRQGRHPGWAAVVAWSPFVLLAGVNDAHIDMAATALGFAAALLVVNGKFKTGGILLGAAVATKFVPLLLAPSLVRRSPLKVVLVAVVTVLVLYLPYLFWTGGDVLGYLPGYLNEEGYDNGTRAVLLSWLPGSLSTFVAAGALALVAVFVMWRLADNPWVGQVTMVGAALLLISPKYGWYALLLMPFIVLSSRYEWLPVPIVLLMNQLYMKPGTFQLLLAGCLGFVLLVGFLRWLLPRTSARILYG